MIFHSLCFADNSLSIIRLKAVFFQKNDYYPGFAELDRQKPAFVTVSILRG
jgi:hypothetical protein